MNPHKSNRSPVKPMMLMLVKQHQTNTQPGTLVGKR